ncbi:MAG: CHASE2 domain-containing protein [bacterium]|nr:CHASE2 domain-containing protein [bacterium]
MNENGQSSGSQKQKGNSIFLLIGVLASVAIVALSWTHFYEDLESSIYDFRFRLRNDLFGQPQQWSAIATIDIDDLALQTYGFPFTRDRHAALLEVLQQYGTSMVGFDIFFYEPSEPHLSPEVVAGQDKESLSKDEILLLIEDHDQDFQIATENSQIVYLAQTFEIAEQGIEFAKQNLRQRTPAEEAGLPALERFSIPLDRAIETGFYHTMDIEIPLVQFVSAAKGV